MKKIVVIAGVVLGGALGAHAQGVVWNNRYPAGNTVWHVYSPQANNVAQQGNISTAYATATPNGDLPAGTTSYNGTLLGGTATGTGATAYANGNNYSIELYGAPGSGDAASSLTPVSGSLETFNSSNTKLAGFFNAPATDPVVSGSAYGGTVSLQARAWYSGAGQYSTYEAALAAGVPTGVGNEVTATLGANPTSFDPVPTFTSFSLTSVPEPSTIALGIMGACGFLFRRRK